MYHAAIAVDIQIEQAFLKPKKRTFYLQIPLSKYDSRNFASKHRLPPPTPFRCDEAANGTLACAFVRSAVTMR
jgi:hypothetical protein